MILALFIFFLAMVSGSSYVLVRPEASSAKIAVLLSGITSFSMLCSIRLVSVSWNRAVLDSPGERLRFFLYGFASLSDTAFDAEMSEWGSLLSHRTRSS